MHIPYYSVLRSKPMPSSNVLRPHQNRRDQSTSVAGSHQIKLKINIISSSIKSKMASKNKDQTRTSSFTLLGSCMSVHGLPGVRTLPDPLGREN